MSLHPTHPRKAYPSPVAPEQTHDEPMMQAPAGTPAIVVDAVPAGHAFRFTHAQLDLQMQVVQCELAHFTGIERALRNQLHRSLHL